MRCPKTLFGDNRRQDVRQHQKGFVVMRRHGVGNKNKSFVVMGRFEIRHYNTGFVMMFRCVVKQHQKRPCGKVEVWFQEKRKRFRGNGEI